MLAQACLPLCLQGANKRSEPPDQNNTPAPITAPRALNHPRAPPKVCVCVCGHAHCQRTGARHASIRPSSRRYCIQNSHEAHVLLELGYRKPAPWRRMSVTRLPAHEAVGCRGGVAAWCWARVFIRVDVETLRNAARGRIMFENKCSDSAVTSLLGCLPDGRPQLRGWRSPGQRGVVATARGDGSYATELKHAHARTVKTKGIKRLREVEVLTCPSSPAAGPVPVPFEVVKARVVFLMRALTLTTRRPTHTLSIFSRSTTKTARPLLQIAPWIGG